MSASTDRLELIAIGDAAEYPSVAPRDGIWAERMRSELLAYWKRMSRAPLHERLRNLDAIVSGNVTDSCRARALSVAALADADVEVIFAATLRYLSLATSGSERHAAHIEDALQWAGRRLTLRPEAVFAALLMQRDDSIDSRLAPIRSVTSSREVATVLCATGCLDALRQNEFMSQWRALERTQLGSCTPVPDRSAFDPQYPVSVRNCGEMCVEERLELP